MFGSVTNVHETNTKTNETTGALITTGAVVFTTVNGQYKQEGDKAIFHPDPTARPDKPVDLVGGRERSVSAALNQR